MNPLNKKIIAWGAGRRAEKLAAFYGLSDVEYFVDSREQGENWKNSGKKIFLPDQIDRWSEYFIVITVAQSDDIINFLKDQGLRHYEDYCTLGELLTQPSWMLKKTIFDKHCYNVECQTIFNHVELNQIGELQCCCVPFVIGRIGNIEDDSIQNIWTGIIHKIIFK